jgi:hypothetical protein
MDYIQSLILYRALIVLGGIICIYFGYKLFYVVQAKQGDFTVKTGEKLELTLKDVSPGIFFALFGAGILVFSLGSNIQITRTFPTPAAGTPKPSIGEALPQARKAPALVPIPEIVSALSEAPAMTETPPNRDLVEIQGQPPVSIVPSTFGKPTQFDTHSYEKVDMFKEPEKSEKPIRQSPIGINPQPTQSNRYYKESKW